MNLANGIIEAYQRKWSMINTFNVQFTLTPILVDKIGLIDDNVNLNIVSFETPDITNDPIESFIANRWFIQNSRDILYRFSCTFRDEDQLNLYRKFWGIYEFTKDNYFDDSKMDIKIFKNPDWYNEEDLSFMNLNGVLIESVSNLSFNNTTENQIAEFTVSFKATEIQINKPKMNAQIMTEQEEESALSNITFLRNF